MMSFLLLKSFSLLFREWMEEQNSTQFYPAVTPMKHSDQHGKICTWCTKWHSWVGGNQQLSN